MSLYPTALFGAKPSPRKGFFVLLLLLGSLTACLKDTSWGNYQLPEATRTGANTVGFKLGETVIVPAGWLRGGSLGTDANSKRIYIGFSCTNGRMNLDHDFKLEINDSIYQGATFTANKDCSRRDYFPPRSMCTSLTDNEKGKHYGGGIQHPFSLRVEYFERRLTHTRMVLGSQGDSVLQRFYNVICAGTFSGVLATSTGELVTISEGRFDLDGSETEE